jgi:hypothetical protein
MRRFLLLIGVGSLAFSLACGGGSNGGGFGSGGGGGNNGFTNASLSGQYAFQLSGFDVLSQNGNPFREAGVFTADGNGHITSGTLDLAESGSPLSLNLTGSYSVSSDGTASMTFNTSNGSLTYALSIANSSKVEMVQADSSGFAGSGVALKQDPTAFSTVPSGTYVFREHEIVVSSFTSQSKVGQFTITNGTVAGNIDSNTISALAQSTITGTFNFPSTANGRGTGTFTDSSSGTSTFLYYILDASHLFFFSADTGIIGAGQAEKQSGTFSNASLNGGYAFAGVGDTNSNFIGFNMAGRFNADGAGNISAGNLDQVIDGIASNPSSPVTFTGTYMVAPSGRADVTLNTSAGNLHQIFWMVSPTRAFFLNDSATDVSDGSLSAQSGSFSSATLNGLYAFNMTGIDNNGNGNTNDFVGTLNWNGTSSVTMRALINVTGTINQPTNFSGTYTVSNNGRVVGSFNNISNNIVFYMISSTDAYILENDTNIEIYGNMTKQQ